MSLWHCIEHGLCGPGACCAKASRTSVGPSTPAPLVYRKDGPPTSLGGAFVYCDRCGLVQGDLTLLGQLHCPGGAWRLAAAVHP